MGTPSYEGKKTSGVEIRTKVSLQVNDHCYGVTSAPPPKGGKVEIKHAFFEPLPTLRSLERSLVRGYFKILGTGLLLPHPQRRQGRDPARLFCKILGTGLLLPHPLKAARSRFTSLFWRRCLKKEASWGG